MSSSIRRIEYDFGSVFEDMEYYRYREILYIRHPDLTNYFLKVSIVDDDYCTIILYRMFDIRNVERIEGVERVGEVFGIGITISDIISLHVYINWFRSLTTPPLDLPRSLATTKEDGNNIDCSDGYNSVGESEEE